MRDKKKITPHSLRHSYVSIVLQETGNYVYVSEQAGHTDVAFTMNRYGHVLKKKDGSPRAPVKAGRLTIEDVLWLYDVIDEVKEELQSVAGPE